MRPRACLHGSAVALLVTTFVALAAIRAAAPWEFRNDDNGAWFTAVAHAHLAKGIGATRGQDHFVSRDTDALVPYVHHPPFVGLYLAFIFRAAGHDDPSVARTAVFLLHGLSLALLLAILRAAMPTRRVLRLWVLFVFAVTPMSVFYGKMPNHEAPALCFVLAGVYAHIRWTRSGRGRPWAALVAAAWTLAAFSAWHAVLAIAGYLVFFPRVASKARHVPTFSGWIIALAAAMLVVTHLLWAGDWQILSAQRDSLGTWMGGMADPKSFVRSIAKTYGCSALFFGCVPWLLATGWLVAAAVARRRRTFRPVERTVLALGAGTAAYSVVFAEAVRVHPYQHFYLLPFVALASGLALRRSAAWLRGRGWNPARLVAACVALTVMASAVQLVRLYHKPYRPAVKGVADIQAQYR